MMEIVYIFLMWNKLLSKLKKGIEYGKRRINLINITIYLII